MNLITVTIFNVKELDGKSIMVNFLVRCFSFLITLRLQFCLSEVPWPNEIIVGNIGNRMRNNVVHNVLAFAEEELKNALIVPSNVTFRRYIGFGCDDISSISAVAQLHDLYKPDVFLGPECSTGMPSAALLTRFYDIPTVGMSITNDLSNKTKYGTLSRVGFLMGPMGKALISLLAINNWTQVAIIRSARVECNTALSGIYAELSASSIKMKGQFYADTVSQIDEALEQVKLVARIIILCFDYIPSSAFDFLVQANTKGMVNSEYNYIIPCSDLKTTQSWKAWDTMNVNETFKKSLARSLFSNTIVIEPVGQDLPSLYSYKISLEAFSERMNQSVTLNPTETYYVPRLHDSMLLYGIVLNKTVQSGGDYKSGIVLFNAAKRLQFEGVCGRIVLDKNSDRIPEFVIYGRSTDDNDLTPLYSLSVSFTDAENYNFTYKTLRKPVWNTKNNETPKDMPTCGFAGELCMLANDKITIGVSVGLICGLIMIFIAVLILYRKRKQEQEAARMSWKFELNELHLVCKRVRVVLSLSSMQKQGSTERTSLTSAAAASRKKCGIYNGDMVTVSRFRKESLIQLTKKQLLYLKTLKSFNHENINRFVGANLDDGPEIVLLWKYCSKGTLSEIIYNDDIQLDMMFKTSMINDIILGLEFLHKSPLGCHGNLNCKTCIVDSRWVVKLTEYGLVTFVNSLSSKKMSLVNDNEQDYSDLVYQAPEVATYGIENVDKKSADIFSLAMIFYQILFRQEPYPDNFGCKIAAHDRYCSPKFPDNYLDFDPKIIKLIDKSWSENCSERPTIGDIKNTLSGFSRKYGKNLVDHIMSMLEKYANNLEKIVEERTHQVIEERRRADQLLYQLLPRTIADALKKGDTILPEYYDMVTIYFSDIVQFTNLCSMSTPFEVVTMLNSLYSETDDLMSNFDVYKVETIGDSYMVVSGLPTRNGLKHVTEIADMALSVLKLMSTYFVPHVPDLGLRLRIGIHSGPVAAGVVGLKMPHFCLFGDTVNFASRMESLGEPDRIQVSESTHELLNAHGNHVTYLRGTIQIKGKGMCNTYWLTEKY